jgi:hypothetical protein
MTPVERVQMEEMFVQVAADAILLRHPQSVWLAQHACIGHIRLTDTSLEAAVERLGVWLAEQHEGRE